jgi:hypothetical protein
MCTVAALAYLGGAWPAFFAFLTIVIFTGLFILKAFDYSEKNPGQALTDGSEFVAYTAMMQGAKNPTVIEGSATPTANTAAPKTLTHDGGGNG